MGFDVAASKQVLEQVPAVLRSLIAEKEKLAAELAQYKRKEEAEAIVSEMEERGLGDSSISFKKKVATLLSSKKDLGVVKEALGYATPDMSFAKTAAEEERSGEDFESFILHG